MPRSKPPSLAAPLSVLLALAPPAQAQSVRAPQAVTAACRALQTASMRRLADAWRTAGRGAARRTTIDGNETCHAGPWGAWALSVADLEIESTRSGSLAPSGRWNLHFITPTGATIAVSEATALDFGPTGADSRAVRLDLADMDGDGTPELFVRRVFGDGRERLRVFTSRGGAASLYAPAQSFTDVNRAEDRDGDGRLDLVWSPRFDARAPECRRFSAMEPIALVARGQRDGTWRVDDPIATGLLRLTCPQVDAPIARRDDERDRGDELASLLTRVACAKIAGASAEEIGRRISTELRGEAFDACMTTEALVDFARAVPSVVTLPRVTVRPPLEQRPPVDAAPSLDADAPPPRALDARVAAACAAFGAQTRQRVLAVASGPRSTSSSESLADRVAPTLGRCVPASSGAWVTSLDALRRSPSDEDDLDLVGAWSLRFLGADGRSVRGLAGSPFRSASMYADSPWPMRAFDYDGDGRDELVLRVIHHVHESANEDRVRVYTARGGAVRPYAVPEAMRSIDGLVDADRDGRPDLVDVETLTLYDDCVGAVSGAPVRTVSTLAHSSPDGRFSLDDAVARQWVRAQCPRPPARLIRDEREAGEVHRDRESSARNVACARFWGVSAEAVLARLHDERVARGAGSDDRCLPTPLLGRFALFTPPFELAP